MAPLNKTWMGDHCKYAMKCTKRDSKCLLMLDLLRDWDTLLPRQNTKIGGVS